MRRRSSAVTWSLRLVWRAPMESGRPVTCNTVYEGQSPRRGSELRRVVLRRRRVVVAVEVALRRIGTGLDVDQPVEVVVPAGTDPPTCSFVTPGWLNVSVVTPSAWARSSSSSQTSSPTREVRCSRCGGSQTRISMASPAWSSPSNSIRKLHAPRRPGRRPTCRSSGPAGRARSPPPRRPRSAPGTRGSGRARAARRAARSAGRCAVMRSPRAAGLRYAAARGWSGGPRSPGRPGPARSIGRAARPATYDATGASAVRSSA